MAAGEVFIRVGAQIGEFDAAMRRVGQALSRVGSEVSRASAQMADAVEQSSGRATKALVLTRRELEAKVDVSGYVTASGRVASAAALSTEELRKLYEQQYGVKVVVDETGGAFVRFGEKLKNAATALAPVSAGLAALRFQAIMSAAEFEKAGNVFRAVSGATAEQLERARRKAIELGKATVFSAADAMQGLVELAKAGMSAEQAIDAISGVLALAAASGVSVAEAATIAASALNAFRMRASEATYVADVLAGAANASAVEITDVAYALQQLGAVAYQAGLSVVDAATAIAILGNAGIRGSDAGTSLKVMLMRLLAPSKEAKKLFKQLGIQIYDSSGRLLDFEQILAQLEKAFRGLTDEQRQQALATIFGADAIRAASILIEAGTKGWAEMERQIDGGGQAAELASANMKGLAGAIEELKGTIESTMIEATLPWTETLAALIRRAADAIEAFGRLPAPIQKAAAVLASLLSAATPVLWFAGQVSLAMPAMASAVGAARKAFQIFRGALNLAKVVALVTNPITWIIAGLAALALAVVLVIRNWDQIRSFMVNLWASIRDWLAGVWEEIKARAGQFVQALLVAFGPLGWLALLVIRNWDQIRQAAVSVWNAVVSAVTVAVEAIRERLAGWAGAVRAFFARPMEQIAADVGFALGRAVRIVIDAVTAIAQHVSTGFQAMLTTVGTFLAQLPGRVMAWFALARQYAVQLTTSTVTAVSTWWSSLPGILSIWWAQVVANATTWFNNLRTTISTLTKTAVDMAVIWVSTMPERVGEWFSRVVATASAWLSSLPARIGAWFNQAAQLVRDAAYRMYEGFRAFVAQIPSVLGEVWSRIWAEISSWPARLWAKARSIAESFWSGFKRGLGISSPSLVERAFFAMAEAAQVTLADLRRLAPGLRSVVAGMVPPSLPVGMRMPELGVAPLTVPGTVTPGAPMVLVVELDGRQIARTMLRYLPGEVARAGVR